MSYKIHLSPEAQLDFDLSLEYYYLEISPSIALKFKNEFVEALEKLEANPLLEVSYHDFRFFSTTKISIYINFYCRYRNAIRRNLCSFSYK